MLKYIRAILEPILIAIGICTILTQLNVPVAWLIGSLLTGIVYAIMKGQPQPLPSIFLIIGKALIGVTAAARFAPDNILIVITYLIPLLLAFMLTASLSMLNGYLIARWSGIKLITSLLGAIPGTASANVAISHEFGADPPVVAVLQYLRLLMVALLVPIIAGLINSDTAILTPEIPISIRFQAAFIENLIALTLCCALGIGTGRILKLPTKEFLGSFLWGIALFGVFPNHYTIPRPLIIIALLLIGLSAGLKFNWHNIAGLGRAVMLEIILVLILIVCCLGIAYVLHLFTTIDLTTAILAFAPGGMEAMIATSNQLGGNTGLVLTIKFINQLLIIFTVNSIRSYVHTTQPCK